MITIRTRALLLRLLICLALLAIACPAEAATGPIRVLFLGHHSPEHHNSAAYLPLLMERCGREGIYFDYFTKPDCLNAETLGHYDAVMLYANHKELKPEQFDALNSFVESGHGFLPIHCASACFGNDPRFITMVGGRFRKHGTGVFKPVILDRNHPIFEGVNEWETWDETYEHDQLNAQGRTLLMERVEEKRREPWTWVREQGRGRVFYTASGHDQRTWENADFQRMLRNAIVWSVGDTRRAEWQAFLAHREPEKREPNANVANYEKRPGPLTFQHPFSVKGSVERIQVPADMRLELFASEPDIAKPIAFAWDERGRLWVAETRDYPHGVTPGGEGNDDIKICEDTDGDGKADKFTVFADHLNLPTSLVFANGGVIVSQPPSFIFLKDTDGDDRADVREVLIKGWGIADTHAQASHLNWGYDNWIHGCVGYSGFRGKVGGKEHNFTMGTYRFARDGSAMEYLHQAPNNAWAESQNAAGDDFLGAANNAPIVFGGIPARIIPANTQIATGRKINLVDKAHAITPNYRQVDVFGGFTAASGSSFIYSKNLPPRLQGQALVCEPTMKLIALMDVKPKGAGYIANDGFNLVASSDEWMSPVFAKVGPDGSVWFADWQNFIIQHNPTPSVERGGYAAQTGGGGAHENPLRDHSRGRIYRVVWEKAQKPAITTLQNADTAQLVKALGSDTQFWRLTAQRLLVEGKGTDAVAALRKMVASDQNATQAIHALWTLDGLGQLDDVALKAALASKHAAVRRNAIRALKPDADGWKLFSAAASLKDADPLVLLTATAKLAEFSTTPEIQTLVRDIVAKPEGQADEWLADVAKALARTHKVSAIAEGPNLLPSPGFESLGADGLPTGWTRKNPNNKPGSLAARWDAVTDAKAKHAGERAMRCIVPESGDSTILTEVVIKPHTRYRLSGWIKTAGFRGGAFLVDEIGSHETERITRDSDWLEVESVFDSGDKARARIVVRHGGKGGTHFDDVKLCEALAGEGANDQPFAGDAKRGELIVFKHQTLACVLCHMIKGQGSTVGPALDGIASRATSDYIRDSLLEPNKVLAKGFEHIGASPMPPLGLILKPQEIADLRAFLQTLK